MHWSEVLLLAFSVSLDALAVSVASSMADGTQPWRNAGRVALLFGGFQFLMPLLGFAGGALLKDAIASFDHYVAFCLLVGVGGKMVWESLHADKENPQCPVDGEYAPQSPFAWRRLLVLAVATSIDALAVGASLALLNSPILLPSLAMGVVTAVVSCSGIFAGQWLSGRFTRFAEPLAGGAIMLIGVKILWEHLAG